MVSMVNIRQLSMRLLASKMAEKCAKMKHVCGAIHEITESVWNDFRSRIKLVPQLHDKIDRLSQRQFCSHVSLG